MVTTTDQPRGDSPAGIDDRDELIARLERIQEEFERRSLSAMAEPLISTPLTMQQLKVLALIAMDPDRAVGHNLAGLLRVSVATMSGIVDRLVDHGMVQRAEDPHDRRVRRLTVTDEGSVTVRKLLSSTGTMPTPVLRRLAIDDLRALVQGISALDRAMRQAPESDSTS
nr:MarR family transcriptional regulator [uncultured Friedmanniella sp.]